MIGRLLYQIEIDDDRRIAKEKFASIEMKEQLGKDHDYRCKMLLLTPRIDHVSTYWFFRLLITVHGVFIDTRDQHVLSASLSGLLTSEGQHVV